MINVRHVGIVVSELERSLHFYKNLLGFDIKKDVVEYGKYIDDFLGLNDVVVQTVKMTLNNKDMIELLHYKTNEKKPEKIEINQIGCTHFAVTVDDIEAIYRRFINEGVDFINPPRLSSDGAAKVAFCKDPDGFYVELVEEIR
tara:strand:+ start:249 stop:677 length:429 start_codon:yes stop_codon:yes gene_type:complete